MNFMEHRGRRFALVCIGLMLCTAAASARPKQPWDAKYKGWYSLPVTARGGRYELTHNGVIVDTIYVPPIDGRYFGVLFVAPRSAPFFHERRANGDPTAKRRRR